MKVFKYSILAAAVLLASHSWADTTEESAEYISGNTLVNRLLTPQEVAHRQVATWMDRVNRPSSQQLGTGNGTGVVVGLVDSGVTVTHSSAPKIAASYNYYTGGTDVKDLRDHGTGTSGIIAGRFNTKGRVEGVAPGASLAVYRVFNTTSSVGNNVVAAGIDWAVNQQRVPILNLSLGSTSTAHLSGAIDNATARGTLVVAAMGNSGKVGAMFPAKFAMYSFARDSIIAVGGLDVGDSRNPTSSWDPALAKWTVFAPGRSIYTTNQSSNDTYGFMTGTSAAAPVVSGQAALIKSNWQFLTAPQIAQVIFTTATRLCSNGGNGSSGVTVCSTAGPDPVFGWGKIDIGRSLQPVGTLRLPLAGNTVNFANARLNSGLGGRPTGVTNLGTVAVDNFNRGFYVDLGANTTQATRAVGTSPTVVNSTTRTTATGTAFTATYRLSSDATDYRQMAFHSNDILGQGYGFGLGDTSNSYFGLESTGTAPLNLQKGVGFNSPYYQLADGGSHVGYTTRLNSTTRLRTGTMLQSAAQSQALGLTSNTDARLIGTAEVEHVDNGNTVVITAGFVRESNSALGLSGSGALALKATPTTNFVTFAGSRAVAENTSVSFMYSTGVTAAYKNTANSLVTGASSSRSQAWSVGLAQRNIISSGDTLGVSFGQPLRTSSGHMNVVTATSQNQEDGSLNYATRQLSLAPSGQERNLTVSYTAPALQGTISAVAQAKFSPGHVADATRQVGFGIKYSKDF